MRNFFKRFAHSPKTILPIGLCSPLYRNGLLPSGQPLRASREYVPGKMTSSDPRLSLVPTGLPPGIVGRLHVCVVAPEEVALMLQREGQEPLCVLLNLQKFMW